MPLLKICGVTEMEKVQELSRYADYIGLIVDPAISSPRRLSVENAEKIVSTAKNRVKTVAVVASLKGVDLAAMLGVDVVQLHCDLDEDLIRQAVRRGLRVAPVLVARDHVVSEELIRDFLERVSNYLRYVEYVLIDGSKTLRPLETGLKLDLKTYRAFVELCRRYRLNPAVAGGVNVYNVELLLKLDPHVVDVSSGVESRPGIKDLSLVAELARKVRGSSYGSN